MFFAADKVHIDSTFKRVDMASDFRWQLKYNAYTTNAAAALGAESSRHADTTMPSRLEAARSLALIWPYQRRTNRIRIQRLW